MVHKFHGIQIRRFSKKEYEKDIKRLEKELGRKLTEQEIKRGIKISESIKD